MSVALVEKLLSAQPRSRQMQAYQVSAVQRQRHQRRQWVAAEKTRARRPPALVTWGAPETPDSLQQNWPPPALDVQHCLSLDHLSAATQTSSLRLVRVECGLG